MNFSFFNKSLPQKDYLPDSIYTVCEANEDSPCTICSNNLFSPVVNGYVHDIQRAKVFCPFGAGETMNKSIYNDQAFLNNLNNLPATTWGRVPQLTPRSLSKIGLEWRTS